MKIVSMGEALIDFKNDAGDGSLDFRGYVGGSPLNVAVAARRLGIPTGFASQVSSDLFGDAIRRHLHDNDVDTSLVLVHNAPSTLAFVAEIAGEAHFRFYGNGAADTLYDPQPRPDLPESTRFVFFGSISLLHEPTATAIVDTVVKARDRALTLFDPNVRPALIPDRTGYLERVKRLLPLASLVKVSQQDLEWLHPGVDPGEVAREWLESGPEAVVVTLGGRGALLARAGAETLRVDAPRVEVVDTVGAGDTFSGALMTALLEALPDDAARDDGLSALPTDAWREALRFAGAAAALNCTRAGAQPPTREELRAFLG